jgi:hypothetical protein
MGQASPRFTNLLFKALDHGVDSVRAGGGPLVPFVMHDDGTGLRIDRMVTPRLEEGPDRCRDFARRLPGSTACYAVVYDGYLTVGGVKHDAIIAEGAERGQPRGARMAQRYRPRRGLLGKFALIGNPALLEDADNLLTASQ